MKHLILVGAGHAHLHILKKMVFAPLANTKVTLITPTPANSEGCVIERFLHPNEQQKPLRNEWINLVRRAKAHWVDDVVIRINTNQKMLFTKKGLQLPYDALSMNIGAKAAYPDVPGLKEHAFQIRQNALASFQINALLKAHTCAVVGTSAFAFDFALSLRDRRQREGIEGPVYLVSSGGMMPEVFDAAKRSKLEKWLMKRGVVPVTTSAVKQVSAYANEEKTIYFEDGKSIDVSAVAWVAERAAHPILTESRLKVDAHGFIMAGPTLQMVDCDSIFATGACKTFIGAPSMDRTGLFVRQEANVLWSNLQQYLNPSFMKSKMKVFVPHRNRFAVLNAGFRQTVLLYQDWVFAGGWCWWFKEQFSS
jgi:NADH dehydrogenase FAD-containing subunit